MTIYDKTGEPLPPDHPFAKGVIIPGRKPPPAPKPSSAPLMNPIHEPPPADTDRAVDEGLQPGLWRMTMEPDSSPVIRDQAGNLIATIHAQSLRAQLARASLVMSAPALLDAVIGGLDVLREVAEHPGHEASLAAQDMIPVLESALAAANMLLVDEADLFGA